MLLEESIVSDSNNLNNTIHYRQITDKLLIIKIMIHFTQASFVDVKIYANIPNQMYGLLLCVVHNCTKCKKIENINLQSVGLVPTIVLTDFFQ